MLNLSYFLAKRAFIVEKQRASFLFFFMEEPGEVGMIGEAEVNDDLLG